MTDLVVGIGEIGLQLYTLLKMRGFHVYGYDNDELRTITNKAQVTVCGEYDMIHICIPFVSDEQFKEAMQFNEIKTYREMTEHLVIHSTVEVGTSKKYNAIYSPVRGVHHDMLECLKWFTKYYAWHEDLVEFTKRFPKCTRKDNTEKLENSKIVATSRYAVDMAIQRYFEKYYPHYPDFMFELNQRYGILPTYYNDNKIFGGHCLLPNLSLLNDSFIKKIIYNTWSKEKIENLD